METPLPQLDWKLPIRGQVLRITMINPFFTRDENNTPLLLKPDTQIAVSDIGWLPDENPFAGQQFIAFRIMNEPNNKQVYTTQSLLNLVVATRTGQTSILEEEIVVATRNSRFRVI